MIYDVYLQDRFIETDVIITQLAQRYSFSAYNLMYLFCSMDVKLHKFISFVENRMEIDACLNDLLKTIYEWMDGKFYIDAKAEFSSSKFIKFENLNMELSVIRLGLFYRVEIAGENVFYLTLSPLNDILLHKFLDKSSFDMVLSPAIPDLCHLRKVAKTDVFLQLFLNITESLTQLMAFNQTNMILSCEASGIIRKYRYVLEMDNFNLSSFDNMDLSDVDFKII